MLLAAKLARWGDRLLTLAAALLLGALALGCALVGSAGAADSRWADFLMDGEQMDFPQQTLRVDLYRRSGGTFRKYSSLQYACQINRVAGRAPSTSGPTPPTPGSVWTTSPT